MDGCEHVLMSFYPTPPSLRCLILVVTPSSGITLYVTVTVCVCVCVCVPMICSCFFIWNCILQDVPHL